MDVNYKKQLMGCPKIFLINRRLFIVHIVSKEKGDQPGQWFCSLLPSKISDYRFHSGICLVLGYSSLCN